MLGKRSTLCRSRKCLTTIVMVHLYSNQSRPNIDCSILIKSLEQSCGRSHFPFCGLFPKDTTSQSSPLCVGLLMTNFQMSSVFLVEQLSLKVRTRHSTSKESNRIHIYYSYQSGNHIPKFYCLI